MSLRAIARKLNRSHTTLSREIRRNLRENGTYMSSSANSCAWERLHRQRTQAPLKHPAVYTYVQEKIRLRWSPEAIAGRLAIDHPGCSIHNRLMIMNNFWDKLFPHKITEHLFTGVTS